MICIQAKNVLPATFFQVVSDTIDRVILILVKKPQSSRSKEPCVGKKTRGKIARKNAKESAFNDVRMCFGKNA